VDVDLVGDGIELGREIFDRGAQKERVRQSPTRRLSRARCSDSASVRSVKAELPRIFPLPLLLRAMR
jgi:hypothetical protein